MMQGDKIIKPYRKIFIALFAIIYLCVFVFVAYKYIHTNRYWEIDVLNDEITEKSGREFLVFAIVKNKMNYSLASKDGYYISYHVYGESGEAVKYENLRTSIDDIKPGASKEIEIKLKAPDKKGRYRIEIDIVKEVEYWFADRGEKTGIIKLTVN